MALYSTEALGHVVREMRLSSGATQEELGRSAGYRAGAGVSISRLESGLLRPGAERLAGIASALGMTLEELEVRATERASEEDAAVSAGTDMRQNESTTSSPPTSRDIRTRAKHVQREIDERSRVITQLGEDFNSQHDRARDEFFMRFAELAARVDGAPQPDSTPMQDDEGEDLDGVAAFRLQSNATGVGHLVAGGAGGAAAGAAVGSAAAYGAFVAAASFGTASTGVAISGLSGVAATNATLALLGGGTLAAGGAGMAGGAMLLASIVATPALLLSLGGLLLMAKRSRRQQQALADQLDALEGELDATKPGYEALTDILPRATDALDYIATHAGHALRRWEDQLGSGSLTWQSMSHAHRQRYHSFIEVAAAQLTIVTLNVQGLLTTRGEDQALLIELADKVLVQSRAAIEAHV